MQRLDFSRCERSTRRWHISSHCTSKNLCENLLKYLWCASVANTMEIKSQWTCFTREECKFILFRAAPSSVAVWVLARNFKHFSFSNFSFCCCRWFSVVVVPEAARNTCRVNSKEIWRAMNNVDWEEKKKLLIIHWVEISMLQSPLTFFRYWFSAFCSTRLTDSSVVNVSHLRKCWQHLWH